MLLASALLESDNVESFIPNASVAAARPPSASPNPDGVPLEEPLPVSLPVVAAGSEAQRPLPDGLLLPHAAPNLSSGAITEAAGGGAGSQSRPSWQALASCSAGGAVDGVCVSPSKGAWYLPAQERLTEQHEEADEGRPRGASCCGFAWLQTPGDNGDALTTLHRSTQLTAGAALGGEVVSRSAWDACGLYSLTPSLSLESSRYHPDPRDSGCLRAALGANGRNSSDLTGASCPYAANSGGDALLTQDDLSSRQSEAYDSPACCCSRSPGRCLAGINEETGPSYEDMLFPQLAGCGIVSSEASLSPPNTLRSGSDEEECLYAPPGDMEACEFLGPCVASTVPWGRHQLREGGNPLSAWYTMGRRQQMLLCPYEGYFLPLGGGAGVSRRRSCPRAAAAATCCCLRNVGGAPTHVCGGPFAWGAPHAPDLGAAISAAAPSASGSVCRGAALLHCVNCIAARQATGLKGDALPSVAGIGSLWLADDRLSGTVCCCRRPLSRSTCLCRRRCSRIPRFGGSTIWAGGCGDHTRDLRERPRDVSFLRCPCKGPQQLPRRGPESTSCCSCAAAATAAAGTAQAVTGISGDTCGAFDKVCIGSQCAVPDVSTQQGAAASSVQQGGSRGREGEGCLGRQRNWGASPLLLPGLCSRRGGGPQEETAVTDCWQQRGLPASLFCCSSSPEHHACFAAGRPPKTYQSVAGVSSSLSSNDCGALGPLRSSGGVCPQSALSPSTLSPLLDRHPKATPSQQQQTVGGGAPLETPGEPTKQGEAIGGGSAPTNDQVMRLSPQEGTQTQQQQDGPRPGGDVPRCPAFCVATGSSCFRTQQRQPACSSNSNSSNSALQCEEQQRSFSNATCASYNPSERHCDAVSGRSWSYCQRVRVLQALCCYAEGCLCCLLLLLGAACLNTQQLPDILLAAVA